MTISFILRINSPESEKKRKATIENNKDIKCLGTRFEFDPKRQFCSLTGESIFTLFMKALDSGEPFCIAKSNSTHFEVYDGMAAAFKLVTNPTEFNKEGIVFFKHCPKKIIKSEVNREENFEILSVLRASKGL